MRFRSGLAALVLTAVTVFSCLTAGQAAPLFSARVDFPTGDGPGDAALADLDADGFPDLVVTNEGSDSISVMLGRGDGDFASAGEYAVGDAPVGLAVADMDGDGAPDLVTANRDSREIALLPGNGDGTFRAAARFAAGDSPAALALGDLDGDGALDAVVADSFAVVEDAFDLPGVPVSQGEFLYFVTAPGGDVGCDSTALELSLRNGTDTWDLAADFRLYPEQENPNRDALGNSGVWHFLESATLTRDPANYTLLPEFITDAFRVEGLQQWQGTVVSNIHRLPAVGINASGQGQLLDPGFLWPAGGIRTVPAPSRLSVLGWRSPIDGQVDIQGSFADLDPGCGDGVSWSVDRGAAPLAQGAVESRGGYSVLLGTGDGSFRPAAHFATPCCWPASLVLGDLDSDGVLDLCAAGEGESVAVMLGIGDGTFEAPVVYSAERLSRAIALGDLNRDGVPDLAVANRYRIPNYQGSVSVFLGKGDGSFHPAVHYETPQGPIDVAAADLDRDGALDLLVANQESYNVSVLGGNGDGTFQSPKNYGTGHYPQALALGRVDADEALDLVVTNRGGGNVSLFLGKGDGALRAADSYATGRVSTGVAVGDLDGDGAPDLAVANAGLLSAPYVWPGSVSVLRGNGDGSFAAGQDHAADLGTWAVAVSDLNADGVRDLVTANRGSGNVSVLLGNGDSTFQPAAHFAAGLGPRAMVAADFDGDLSPDLAVANQDSNNISVLLGEGNGDLLAPAHYSAGSQPGSLATADLDGDGDLDLAAANQGSDNVSVLRGNGDGSFGWLPQNYPAGESPIAVAIGDLNGDGDLDLAVANGGDGSVSVLLGNGSGAFQAAVPYALAVGSSLAIADLDGDGDLDLAAAGGQARIGLLPGNGDGSFQPCVSYGTREYYWTNHALAVADLDADFAPDLAVAMSTSTDGNVAVLLNRSVFPPCADGDGDGYGDPATPRCEHAQRDCDDADPSVSPGAAEVCGNGKDDDCDGLPDAADPECGQPGWAAAAPAHASSRGPTARGAGPLAGTLPMLALPLILLVALRRACRRDPALHASRRNAS